MNEENIICRKCGCDITIPDDLEDTGFCNECAQFITMAAESFVLAHREDYEELKDSNSMDIDLEFLHLCEAVLPIEEHYQP